MNDFNHAVHNIYILVAVIGLGYFAFSIFAAWYAKYSESYQVRMARHMYGPWIFLAWKWLLIGLCGLALWWGDR